MFRLPGRTHRSQEALSEYLDNRLSPGERHKVDLHLIDCGRCREDLESLRATVNFLQRVPVLQPRRSFVLTEAPQEALAPARRTLPNWAVGLATSAAMLAFVAVLSTDLTGVLATKQASDGLEAPAITSSAAKSDVANEPAAPKPDVGQDIAIDIPPISAAAPAPEESTSLPFAAPKDAKSQESRAEGLLPPDELTATEGLEVEQDGEGVQPEAATSDELTLPAEETSQESPAGTALAAPLPGDEGTPTYWRVVESVLGALAALLAGAFVWRRRRASTR